MFFLFINIILNEIGIFKFLPRFYSILACLCFNVVKFCGLNRYGSHRFRCLNA